MLGQRHQPSLSVGEPIVALMLFISGNFGKKFLQSEAYRSNPPVSCGFQGIGRKHPLGVKGTSLNRRGFLSDRCSEDF